MADIEQEQIRNSQFYDDTVAAGAGMESPAAPYVVSDLDSLRSQVNRIILGAGTGNWYDPLQDNFGLGEIHDKKLFYVDPFDLAVQQVTLGVSAAGVLIDASLISLTPKTLAIGSASTTLSGVAATPEPNFTVAGTLGVGLTQLTDSAGILINKIDLIDDSTNEPPQDNGDLVFGLFQALNGTSDGTAIAVATAENSQISFVKIDAATNTLTSVSLPAGTYNFNLRRCTNFYNASAGILLSGAGALPDVIDPGKAAVRLPFRAYDISAPGAILGPAANDQVNVTTGVFTTAGAQTNDATFGTPALPATGAQFRDDNRIKIWRNGVLQSKGEDAAANRRVYWISTTQMAFERRLFIGEAISWEMPSDY